MLYEDQTSLILYIIKEKVRILRRFLFVLVIIFSCCFFFLDFLFCFVLFLVVCSNFDFDYFVLI